MSLFVAAAADAEVGGAAAGFTMGFVGGCSMGLVDVFGVSKGLDGNDLVGASASFEVALAGAAAGLVAVATGLASTMGLEGVTIDSVDAPVAAGLGGTLAAFGRIAAVAAASFEGGGKED
jgi:hypothetical protein